MSFSWLASTLQSRRAPSGRRQREQARRRRIALEPLEDRTLLSTYQWTGATNGDWSQSGNWDIGGTPVLTVPGASDDVVLDGTISNNNSHVNINKTVNSVSIQNGYTGTLSLDADLTTNGSFSQSSGTLEANSATWTVVGSFTVSGGTFHADTGTVKFGPFGNPTIDTGASAGFNNVELASGSGGNVTITQMIVNGTLTITNVGTITGTIHAKGDVTTSDTGVEPGPGTILFDGAGPQTLSATADHAQVPSVKIDKTAGSLTLAPSKIIGVTGNWTYVKGAVVTTGSTISFESSHNSPTVDTGAGPVMKFNNVVIQIGSGNTLTVPTGKGMAMNGSLTMYQFNTLSADLGAITVAGDLTSYATSIGGGTNITMNTAANATITGGAFPSGGVILSKMSGTTLTANVTTPLRGPLSLVNLGVLQGTFQVANNVTSNDTSVSGNSDGSPVLVFNGYNTAQTLTAGVPNAMVPGLEFNKTGGSGSFTLVNNANVQLPNALNVSGGWIVDATNTRPVVTAGTNVKFMLAGGYGSRTIDTGGSVGFDNVELACGSGSTLTINKMVVGGGLLVSNVGVVNGTIDAHGDVTTSDKSVTSGLGTPGPGRGTIRFSGTGDQTLYATVDNAQVPSVIVAKTTGTLTLDPSYIIGVTGDWNYTSGAVTTTGSTVSFQSYGSASIDTGPSAAMLFSDVLISKGSGDTLSVANLGISGSLTINQVGLINAPADAITVAGDLTSNDSYVGGSANILMNNVYPNYAPAKLSGGTSGLGDFPDGGIKIQKVPTATVTLLSNLSGLSSLNVYVGTLDVGAHTLGVKGNMLVQSGGVLSFTAPAGKVTQLTVNGNLTFDNGSQLDVDLTGASTGTWNLIAVLGAGHSLTNSGVNATATGGSVSVNAGPNGTVSVTRP